MTARYAIPVHPQPGIFESIIVEVNGRVVSHADISEILHTPKWNAASARHKAEAAIRKRKAEAKRRRQHPECTITKFHGTHKITVNNGMQVTCVGKTG